MLVHKFKSQFSVYTIQPKEAISLTDIKQRYEESLQSYLTKFNTTTTTIRKLDEMLVHIDIVVG